MVSKRPNAVTLLCKLCNGPGPLIDSHVIPDFFIRSLERRVATGQSGQSQPTSILLSTREEVKGGQRQRGYWERQVGVKEKLLCANCEGQFSRWEHYFREFFYGTHPSPLVKIPVGTPLDIGHASAVVSGLLGARAAHVNYTQFKLFILSLL